jgi:3-oxoacyl-[acyl-carrier protein] reductase
MSTLSGKVAIVTGASRGIGAAIALRLAAEKANVIVNYVSNKEKALEVVEKIQQSGGQAIAIQADVSKAEDVKRLFQEAVEKFGGLDILVNNAAVFNSAPVNIADATEELYDQIFGVSARGTFLCQRESVKYIRNGGRVINLSSTGVNNAHSGMTIYKAAKSAVETLTRGFAKELKGHNVTVNCIAPGATTTDQFMEGKTENILQNIANLSPLNRIGTPEDMANVVAFLVSKEAEWINGQIISLNGGFA